MADLDKKLQNNPFPNEHIDPKDKESKEFGRKVGAAIIARHEYNEYYGYEDRERIWQNRYYSAGNQNPDQYKPLLDAELDGSGNRSYMNIDWSIHSPAPKFVDLIVGSMINQDYKIELNAIDPSAKQKRQGDRDEYYGKYMRKQDAEQLEQMTGVPLEERSEEQLESPQEIDMYMEMDYKLPKEIGMEQLIDFILHHNDWEKEKKRVIRDLVENNKGAIRIYTDNYDNIHIRYVDIANYISSYSDEPDYADVDYEGEIYEITIRELRNMADGELSEEDLFHIARSASGQDTNPRWPYGRTYQVGNEYEIDDYRVRVLDFVYYTTDVYKWRYTNKNGNKYLDSKPYNWQPPERPTHPTEEVRKELEAQYSGIYVLNADKVVSYGKQKNIVRQREKGKLSPKTVKPFVVFEPNKREGGSKSIVERMRPMIDSIQLHVLKQRHFVSEAAPPGVQIDVDAINDIMLGAEEIDPQQIMSTFKQKGILIANGKDEHGTPRNRPPIIEMQNGIQDGLRPHMEAIQYEMNQIREITGINTARDGSETDSDALVGIQKMKLLASNNATREIYDAFTFGILSKVGEAVVRILQDQIENNADIEFYKNVIGEIGFKELEFGDLSMAEYGIKLEALPEGEDLQRLDNYIDISLQNQDITLEDAMEVRKYMNTKKAKQFLIQKRKQRRKEMMQEQQQQAQIEAQKTQQQSMASAKAKEQEIMAELQRDRALQEQEYDRKEQLLKLEYQLGIEKVDRQAFHEIEKTEKSAELEEEKNVNKDSNRQINRTNNE